MPKSLTRLSCCPKQTEGNGLCDTSQDGYAVDEHGIHHRVLSAVVETTPGRDCFGILSVFEDRLELQGYDRLESAVMQLPKQQQRPQQHAKENGKENVQHFAPVSCSSQSQLKVMAG